MIDWNSTFNIVFVAVSLALVLFLLVSTIVVAVKGKRKCNAFDVILRILSTLVFIGSTAMFAAAVLCMLNGPLSIAVTEKAAMLFAWEKAIELPLPELFAMLATQIGLMLVAVLFLLGLVALICDCLIANKKKEKAAPVQKTPEQRKMEAEIARINKIADIAVKKADVAAKSQDKTAEAKSPAANETAEPEPDFDWRTETPAQQAPREFVGVKDNYDEFDSFDVDESETDAADEQNDFEENAEGAEQSEASETEELEKPYETEEGAPEQTEEQAYTYEQEQGEKAADNFEPESEPEEYVSDEQERIDEEYAEQEDSVEETADEQVEDKTEESEEYYAEDDGELSEDDTYASDNADDDDFDAPPYDETSRREAIEPDRSIYIPGMRTYTRQEPHAKSVPPQRGKAQRQDPAPKPAQKTKSTATKPAAEKTTKKPTAKKSTSTKSTDKTNAAKKAGAKVEIPAEKKLPLNRRYVIIDRHNAVNLFGEYLKERSKAEKDRLTSSINTIIIK